MLVISTALSAQDTITYGYPGYQYANPMPGTCSGIFAATSEPYPNGYHLAQSYRSTGDLIYGVAITSTYLVYVQSYLDSIDSIMTGHGCFTATLLKAGDSAGTAVLLEAVPLQYPATWRYFDYQGIDASGQPRSTVFQCHEFYFDHPYQIDSADEFFVGLINPPVSHLIVDNEKPDPCGIGYINGVRRAYGLHLCYGFDTVGQNTWVHFPDIGDFTHYTDGYYPYLNAALPSLYGLGNLSLWGGIFPILYPKDTICHAPQNAVWIDSIGQCIAILEWDTIYDTIELAIMPQGGDPDTATNTIILPGGNAGYTAAGLASGTIYDVWMRRQCHWKTPTYNTFCMSPWANLATFSTPADQSDLDIAGEVQFSLSPNPAHGTFSVATGCLPATLALYDPQGRTVYTTTLRAQRTDIGIADLPHGVYHVSLTAADGRTSTRRLVIE